MRILAALGRSARMSPAESADVVIEMDAVNGELGPDFAALECPTVFVVGTGAHSGATEEEMRTVRAAVADAEASNERVSVFATTPHKHTQILSKAPDTVVAAIEDVIQRVSLTGARSRRSVPEGSLHREFRGTTRARHAWSRCGASWSKHGAAAPHTRSSQRTGHAARRRGGEELMQRKRAASAEPLPHSRTSATTRRRSGRRVTTLFLFAILCALPLASADAGFAEPGKEARTLAARLS